jgi:hypothetical protein
MSDPNSQRVGVVRPVCDLGVMRLNRIFHRHDRYSLNHQYRSNQRSEPKVNIYINSRSMQADPISAELNVQPVMGLPIEK